MAELFNTDYVIYDRANDQIIRWESSGDIVVFGDKEEALKDCRGNEEVIRCTELPVHHQEELLYQLKKYMEEDIYYFEDWVSNMLNNSDYSDYELMCFEEHYQNLLTFEENTEIFIKHLNN
jgi:hypothetical protein